MTKPAKKKDSLRPGEARLRQLLRFGVIASYRYLKTRLDVSTRHLKSKTIDIGSCQLRLHFKAPCVYQRVQIRTPLPLLRGANHWFMWDDCDDHNLRCWLDGMRDFGPLCMGASGPVACRLIDNKDFAGAALLTMAVLETEDGPGPIGPEYWLESNRRDQ